MAKSKFNPRAEQKNLERALALEYVKPFCLQKGLSFKKLEEQVFEYVWDRMIFAQPTGVEPDGLINDIASQPLPTLVIHLDNGELVIEITEYTEKYLKD